MTTSHADALHRMRLVLEEAGALMASEDYDSSVEGAAEVRVGVSPAIIDEASRRLKLEIPEEWRAFVSLRDGWGNAPAGVMLFSFAEAILAWEAVQKQVSLEATNPRYSYDDVIPRDTPDRRGADEIMTYLGEAEELSPETVGLPVNFDQALPIGAYRESYGAIWCLLGSGAVVETAYDTLALYEDFEEFLRARFCSP